MTMYEIVEAQPMPRFDPNRTVKNVLLSPVHGRRVTKVMRTYGVWITVVYSVASLLFPVVLFAPTSIAQQVAVLETVLELPLYAMVFLLLRTDLVVLVVKSYDYWFFSISTLVFTCSFSLLLRDARTILLVSRWFGFHVAILVDANMTHAKSLVRGLLGHVVLVVVGLIAVSLDLVADTSDTSNKADTEMDLDSSGTGSGSGMLTTGNRPHTTLSVRDLLMNSLVTMGVLMMRIVIRKRALSRGDATKPPDRLVSVQPSPTNHGTDAATATIGASDSVRETASVPRVVKCVTLRCSIKLRAVASSPSCRRLALLPPSIVSSIAHTIAADQDQQQADQRKLVTLRCIATDTRYDSEDVVLPAVLRIHTPTHLVVVFHSVGVMGLVLTAACWFTHSSSSATAVSVAALACTGSYLCVLALFYNRMLFRQVTRSFDFVFLSLQLIMAHACVADMLKYELAPSVALVSMVMWIHGVLTLDALPPDMKQRLGFYYQLRCGVMAVLAVYVAGQCTLVIQGLLLQKWQLRDRVFLSWHLMGHHFQFRVLPFFISRMMTVTVWTLRLLWRVAWQHDPHTLIMLRGRVEFEYERSRLATTASFTSIMPAASTILITAPTSTKPVRSAPVRLQSRPARQQPVVPGPSIVPRECRTS